MHPNPGNKESDSAPLASSAQQAHYYSLPGPGAVNIVSFLIGLSIMYIYLSTRQILDRKLFKLRGVFLKKIALGRKWAGVMVKADLVSGGYLKGRHHRVPRGLGMGTWRLGTSNLEECRHHIPQSTHCGPSRYSFGFLRAELLYYTPIYVV